MSSLAFFVKRGMFLPCSRHREIDRCVRLMRSEIRGGGLCHFSQMRQVIPAGAGGSNLFKADLDWRGTCAALWYLANPTHPIWCSVARRDMLLVPTWDNLWKVGRPWDMMDILLNFKESQVSYQNVVKICHWIGIAHWLLICLLCIKLVLVCELFWSILLPHPGFFFPGGGLGVPPAAKILPAPQPTAVPAFWPELVPPTEFCPQKIQKF